MWAWRQIILALVVGRGAALRFEVGERVECYMGDNDWQPGTVARTMVKQMNDQQTPYVAAFVVALDNGSTAVAPHDDDRFIRREGELSTPVSSRLLRFSVGARVEANLGLYWAKGRVVALNYRDPSFASGVTMPYEIQLDSGEKVFAPSDDDAVVRKDGTILMKDASLRFGVGDRVECFFSDGDDEGDDSTAAPGHWLTGMIVALHYHESRFGKGVTVPYQVKLDDDRGLIYIPQDLDSHVRRASSGKETSNPPDGKLVGRGASDAKESTPSKIDRRRVGRKASKNWCSPLGEAQPEQAGCATKARSPSQIGDTRSAPFNAQGRC